MNNKITILVADDEPFILRSLSFVLKRAGYNVISAINGQEAWNKLSGGANPKIVFLDVQMPILSGFEVCKLIKSDVAFKDVYVVLLTARWQEADRTYAKSLGVDEYITKPFSPSYIIRRVHEILAEKQGVVND